MDEKYSFAVPQKALIRKGNKYLVLKRSSSKKIYPGYWDSSGGKLEHGEEPEKGLAREVFEETGLKIKVGKPLFVYLETNQYPAYVVLFDCEVISGEIKLSPEHSAYKWATKKELKELELEPYLKKFLEEK